MLPSIVIFQQRNSRAAAATILEHRAIATHSLKLDSGWDKSGKPGNQVATKSLPSSEIFDINHAADIK